MDLKKRLNLGATGAFPDGKLNKTDEGELRMRPEFIFDTEVYYGITRLGRAQLK